jgi:hypothetical protein
MIRYPTDFNSAIEKYDGRSDSSIWLKMYSIATRASGGNEDHMVGYFTIVMGKAPLLWLDNLPAECITSWATLSRLFTTNYQATYIHPGNTHHLAKVRMRRDETLREYTNRYFENRNTLAGVKDEDVIAYYKKGFTNIKLFVKITVIAGPSLATMIGIDVIIAATTAAMTGATTTVEMTAITTSATTGQMIHATIGIARTTTIARTIIGRNELHRHRPKGATSSTMLTTRSTSSSVVAKRSKATDRPDQTPGRPGMSTLKTRELCVGLNSQSLSTGKIIGFTSLTPEPTPLVINRIVNGAFLPKTLIDGGSSLNIIFTKTLRKMEFDFNKMTACDEPFYWVVPGKAAYPIGRVCLPITFDIEENFRTEYLTYEVANFCSSYHAIFKRPMLAIFMAVPHHTYLIMKMPAPNGILSIFVDIMVSYNRESVTVELSKDLAIKAAATIMVARAAKIDQTTLQVPEQKRTSIALDPSPAVKKVCLGRHDASKEVFIRADLDPK